MDREQGVRWKEFEVKDIFETMPFKNGLQVPTGALVSANHLEMGSTPRITVTSDNNGIGGYYKDFDDKNYRVYENCISVSFLGTVFYHPYKASFDMKVHCLKPKNHVLSEYEALFILPIIRRKLHSNDYFNQTKSTDLPYMKLFLPATTDDTPDWDYMAKRIKELETERIKELEAYLLASGLDDYELTEADKQVLAEEVQWKEFRIGDLFEIHSPVKKFNANKVSFNGKYPYVARGTSNNGIRGYITEDVAYLNPAHTLSFGQDTATVYYQNEPYFTGDKIKIMELKNVELTESIAAFLVPVVRRAFSGFAWGQNSFNEKVLNNIEVVLPVGNDNQPDWDYMERYIRVIEKSVITDVVKWKDRQITVTKQVVDKSIA